ncbi:MAG: DUF3467 domain-containing protein [Paludibacteraceae bacterium]|nr:DUF3467 domain-containing protein [Paludibacteraceae bacterium]
MEQQMSINISPEVASGKYSNLAIIGHSATDFVLDFAAVLPGGKGATVQSRVILAPEHAKRLLAALQDNIQKYEQQFGTIQLRNNPPAQNAVPIAFGGEA